MVIFRQRLLCCVWQNLPKLQKFAARLPNVCHIARSELNEGLYFFTQHYSELSLSRAFSVNFL